MSIGFPYRLVDETGSDLGRYEAITPTWVPGDTIHRGRDMLVVVRVVSPESGGGFHGILVVKPAIHSG